MICGLSFGCVDLIMAILWIHINDINISLIQGHVKFDLFANIENGTYNRPVRHWCLNGCFPAKMPFMAVYAHQIFTIFVL